MKEQNTQISSRTLAFIIFIAALLLRFAYIASLEIDNPIRADAFNYFTLAYNVVVNGAYSLSTSEPFVSTTYVTPGYPLFLASVLSISKGVDFFKLCAHLFGNGLTTYPVKSIASSDEVTVNPAR